MAVYSDNTQLSRILGSDGRPMPSAAGRDASLALPSVVTFSGLLNSGSRVYPHGRQDTALREDKEFASAMRRDPFIRGLIQERKLAALSQEYSVEVDDPRDPTQKVIKATMTRMWNAIKYRKKMLNYRLEAIWFGKYASQVAYEYQNWSVDLPGVKTKRAIPVVSTHQPVNGDKIDFLWDGTPAIQVNGMAAGKMAADGAEIKHGTNSFVLVLRGAWRQRFILTQHESYDADFNSPEQAGMIHGVGVRDVLYHLMNLRAEWLANTADWCERFGLGGVRLWYYQAGNSSSKTEMEKAARSSTSKTNILVPRYPESKSEGVEFVSSDGTGADVLLRLVAALDEYARNYVNGQTMSTGADTDGSLGGTGKANLASDTKSRITQYDTDNLAEHLTEDWLRPSKRWAFHDIPEIDDIPVRLAATESKGDPTKTMAVIKQAFDMGAKFAEKDVVAVTGIPQPQEGDEILSAAKMQSQGPGGPGGPEGGADGQPVDDVPPDQPPSPEDVDGLLEDLVGEDDGGQGQEEADDPQKFQRQPLRYEQVHSPVGGTTVNGTFYLGGEFIPGSEVAKASPKERAELQQGSPKETKGREHLVREAANKVQFSGESVAGGKEVGKDDFEEIEKRLTPEEQDDMESAIERSRDLYVDSEIENWSWDGDDFDEEEAAKDAGWDDDKISDVAIEYVNDACESKDLEKDSDEAEQVRDSIVEWYKKTSRHGLQALQELSEHLGEMSADAEDDDVSALVSDVQDRMSRFMESDIEEAVQEVKQKAKNEARDEAGRDAGRAFDRSDYSADAKNEFLLEVWKARHDEWANSARKENTWGKGDGGLPAYLFSTTAGQRYEVSTWDRSDLPVGRSVKEIAFSDSNDSFSVTGAGNAAEVFTKVSAAVVALLSHQDVPVAYFTAAEKSRRRLYDRLVSTVAKVLPAYAAIAVDVPGKPKSYMIAKRELMDGLKAKLSSLPVEQLAYARDAKIRIADIQPECREEWFTANGWAEFAKTDHYSRSDLSAFYAAIWNCLDDVSGDEMLTADQEGACLDFDGTAWQEPRLDYAAKHAPKGGVTINGKHFRGGQFVPGAAYAAATPAEKAKIDDADNARKATRAGRKVSKAGLKDRLNPHKDVELSAADRRRAKAALAALKDHHGELTLHRLDELADQLEKALPGAEGVRRDQILRQLASIHGMIEGVEDAAANKDGVSGAVEGGAKKAEPATEAPKAEAPSEAKAKEPWEMTAVEYADANAGKFDTRSQAMDRGKAKNEHSRLIADRVLEGQDVPNERLAEYPHLDMRKMTAMTNDVAAKMDVQKEAKQGIAEARQRRLKQLEEMKRGSEEAQRQHDEEALAETLADYLDKTNLSEGSKAKILAAKPSARGLRVDPETGATVEVAGGSSWYMPHYNAVKAALAAGKPVPPEVLADYPDLAAKGPQDGDKNADGAKGAEKKPWEQTREESKKSAAPTMPEKAAEGGKVEDLLELAGDQSYVVSGNTFAHKDAIKAAGAKWNGYGWEFSGKNAKADADKVARLPGVKVAGKADERRESVLSELRQFASRIPEKHRGPMDAAIKKLASVTDALAWEGIGSIQPSHLMDAITEKKGPDYPSSAEDAVSDPVKFLVWKYHS